MKNKLDSQIRRKLCLFSLKNSAIKNAPWLIIALLLLFGFFLIKPIIAGDYEETNIYNQTLNLQIAESREEPVILEHSGILNSLKITGQANTVGTAKVYLKYNNDHYLIFNKTNFITKPENNTKLNQSNESKIIIKLDYKEGTQYDEDDDGIETTQGVIDFTIENSIINNLTYDRLCAKWETYSKDSSEITTICNGNEQCCNFISLIPISAIWNETFLLNYGKYGATYDNIVSAQILYVDYNTSFENPYLEIYNSEWQKLGAIFYEEFASFKDICIDTCNINFNISLPILIFNLTNATINIDYITYGVTELIENITNQSNITEANATLEINETLDQEFAEIGKPVKWRKTINLNKNATNITINLTSYASNIRLNKIINNQKHEISKVKEKAKEFGLQSLENKEIVVEEEIKDLEIEYETPAPIKTEQILDNNKKKITVSSDVSYQNILTYTTLETEAIKENIKLYWLNPEKQQINFVAFDKNDNNLIDYIEWITPHLSTQEFIVETVSVSGDDTNLTIWDTTDATLKNVYEPIYFYANFTNITSKQSINGSDINCTFSENSTGSWISTINMTFNTTTLLYEYNQSFSIVNASYYNISCTINWTQTLSATDMFQIGWLNITITLSNYNISTNRNMTLSGHINKSDGSNVTDHNISIYLNGDKLYYDATNKLLTTTLTNYLPNTTSYGDYAYNFTSPSTDGVHKIIVNLTYSGIDASNNISFLVNSTPPTVNLDLPANGTAQKDGNVTFKYTPKNGIIDTCILYGNFNGSWSANTTQTSLTSEQQQTIYLNLTNGTYIWNVWCNNTLGNAASNATNFTITIDTIQPSITLNNPIYNYNLSSTFVNFNWTVLDNLDKELLCNLTINNTVNVSYIASNNGTATNYTVSGFADATYSWNLTCVDNATNQNTSSISIFTIDTKPPVINLDLPANRTAQKDGNVTFKYTPSDDRLDTCILYGNFNGSWSANTTQTSLTSGSQQTIYLNLTNGTYIWNVWCNDTVRNSAYNSTNYTIIIDNIAPQISLTYPINNSWLRTTTITFNYTLTENNPSICKLYVNTSAQWSVVANYTSPINGSNNFTATLEDGTYIWNVWCNDTVNLFSTNETNLTVQLDTVAPTITNETKSPAISYHNDTVVLNATIYDNRSLNTTWIEGNWTGQWQNYTTEIGKDGSKYLYNVSAGNFSNQEVVGWRFYANDSAGNLKQGELQSFKVENIALPEQPNLTSPANNTLQVYNNINFTWLAPFDKDNDTLSYELLVANDTSFTEIELNKTNLNATSYSTLANGNEFTGGIKYWEVRARDPANYSNYSIYYTINVIDAIINISNPINRTVLYPGNITNISITEVRSGAWVNNVTLIINGVNYTLLGNPYWNFTYIIPTVSPRYINITAIGFNLTTNITISNYIQLRVSKFNATLPSIRTVCSNETYIINNTNATLSVNALLDTLIDMINVTLTTPSNQNITLNESSYTETNLTYAYYYYYVIDETGSYTLKANIRDIENRNTSSNYTFFSYTNESLMNVNLTATGISSMSLNDVCGDNAIHSGTTNIDKKILGQSKYNLKFITSGPTVIFDNFRGNGTFSNALNYTDLAKSIAPPTAKRAVIEFEITSNITDQPVYDNITIRYNYSSVESALDNENGLVMYKCTSRASCSWASLTATLNTTTNIISAKVINLSVFLVAEAAETTTTVTQTVSSGGGGGGGVTERNVSQITSLEIKSSGPLLLEQESIITAPITVRNNGKVYLNRINLSVTTNSSELTPSLSDYYINALNLAESKNITLTIKAKQKPGRYKTTIHGFVERPPYETSLDVYVDIAEKEYQNKKEIITKIQFAHDLFKENPECLELDELLKNAEIALNQTEIQKAASLIENAVQSCRDLVAAKEKGILPSPKKSPELYIFIAEIFILIIMMIVMISYYRARRRRRYLGF